MIRAGSILGLSLLVASSCLAFPAAGGGKGLFRVQDVASEGQAMLSLSLHTFGDYTANGNTVWHLQHLGGITYAPLSWFEFYVGSGYRENLTIGRGDLTQYGFDDLNAGVKFSLLLIPIFKVGVLGSYRHPTLDPTFVSPPGLVRNPSFGGKGLVTFDFGDISHDAPFRLHFNGGYFLDRDALAGQTQPGLIQLGTGVELPAKEVAVFVEATTDQPVNNFSLTANPVRIAPGVRFFSPFKLGLDLGMEFGLNQATPDWRVVLGLSFISPFLKPTPPPPPAVGTVAASVRDAATGKPLAADIIFPGSDRPALRADPVTGLFQVDSVPAGVFTVEVRAPGYIEESAPIVVKDKEIATYTFNLRPIPVKTIDKGTFTGKVYDRKTEAPLAATLSFPDSKVGDVRTDPQTGIFKVDLPVGTYAVVARSEGYIDQSAPVVVEKDKGVIRDFALVKKGMTITLRGIYFDFNKSTIKPESYPVLDKAAQILKDNPSIRVEIQGHTDYIGSDSYNLRLSDARAASVVNYFIMYHGIDPRRLVARGYGESMPIADNTTEAGRALNRRVEFVILGTE